MEQQEKQDWQIKKNSDESKEYKEFNESKVRRGIWERDDHKESLSDLISLHQNKKLN